MYIVIELQTNGGVTANIVSSYASQTEAESRYHSILASAAISSVEVHAAAILTEEGFCLRSECYKHTPAPVQEVDDAGDA